MVDKSRMDDSSLPLMVFTVEMAPDRVQALQQLPQLEGAPGRIEAELKTVLGVLGVPGRPEVRIRAWPEGLRREGQLIRLWIDDRRCRYADEQLQFAYHYVNNRPPDIGPDLAEIERWFAEKLDTIRKGGDSNAPADVIDFLGLSVAAMVKARPALLLGPAQVEHYRAGLAQIPLPDKPVTADWLPGAERLQLLLSALLDLRISLADAETVAQVLLAGLDGSEDDRDLVEGLIAALRVDVVEIHLPQQMLQEISKANAESDAFAMLRDGMFYELGMLYPSFHFVPADHLKPNAFAFKVNDLTLPPRVGLARDQCIVGEDLWSAGPLDQVTINPAFGWRFQVIAAQHQQEVESAGHTIWDQLGYLLLCLAADLRQNGHCFVDAGFVSRHIDWLQALFPALVETVQERFSIEQLSRALRLLAAEEVSVRNLRAILEAMLDLDYVVADPAEYILFDQRLAVHSEPGEDWRRDAQQMASMARTALRRYLSSKYGWSMEIFLLDPEIEQMLRETVSLGRDAEFEARLLRAVRYQVGARAVGSGFPPVLTSEDVRPALRRIIAMEFPLMPVLAWRELAPETNLEPVARISF